MLRGYRAGILTSTDYANLCQCESIDGTCSDTPSRQGSRRRLCALLSLHVAFPQTCADMKMHLSSTDYGNFLQNEPSPISTTTLAQKCTEKLVEEFTFLRNQAVEPLATFLDYVTCVLLSLKPLAMHASPVFVSRLH